MSANPKIVDREAFGEILDHLSQSEIPFMVGGALAIGFYTSAWRDTKDVDIFCKASDSIKFIEYMKKQGFETEITDSRWLAKATHQGTQLDIIFANINGIGHVNDSWIKHSREGELWERKVKFLAPEELIWMKIYLQDRSRYDGADINHLILKEGENLKWRRVLDFMEQHWELLFGVILNFRFVYPSYRDLVPNWLIEELTARLLREISFPPPRDKICMGPILSRTQYEIDIRKWGFKTIT